MSRSLLFVLFAVIVSLSVVGCRTEEKSESTFASSSQIQITAPSNTSRTNENGESSTFGLHLGSKPLSSVTVTLASSDTTEGTVSPETLTFTADDWDTDQTVTVAGVDDAAADGDQIFNIVFSVSSADSGYDGVEVPNLELTNADDDVAAFVVSAITGNTGENGDTATFTVKLNGPPVGTVTLPVSSSDTSESTVSVASLEFTETNWAGVQTVTVSGVNDNYADGTQDVSIILGAATNTGGGYDAVDPDDIKIKNIDDDTPGVTVSAISGQTTEAGGTATFTVKLNFAPPSDVVIKLTSSNEAEGVIDKSKLTFTSTNYAGLQTVTVTGKDDFKADGAIAYTITLASISGSNTGYDGVNPDDVSVTNADNDVAGIQTLDSASAQIHNSDGTAFKASPHLTTTEGAGTDTFKMRLTSEPLANVTVALTDSDSTESSIDKSSIVFTASNWNSYQTVTATGVNDYVADGDIDHNVAFSLTSTDANYNAFNVANVVVRNTDDDTPGITVGTLSNSGTIHEVQQGNTNTELTFTVRLASEPVGNVVLDMTSLDTTEATVSPATLTYNAANWNGLQTVTVTSINDATTDGNIVFQVQAAINAASTTDTTGYASLAAATTSDITNIDAGSAIIVTSVSSITTGEDGTSATFDVNLAGPSPDGDVVLTVSSSDTTEGTVSPGNLTFSSANYQSPKTVTVTGVNDSSVDGDQSYTISLTRDNGTALTTDTVYASVSTATVAATNIDNDSAQIIVSAASGATTEAGGTATFTVSFTSAPTANVSIDVSSSDTTEGTVSPSRVTFTSVNWAAPKVVTVTGVDDLVQDGNQVFTVVLDNLTTTDLSYGGKNPSDVSVTNNDDDVAGFLVSAISGTTSEAGATATFTVKLQSQPTANVVISNIASSNTAEGTVSPTSLTFTSGDWNVAQTVTVTGVDESIADNDRLYSIVLPALTNAGDPNYSLNPNDVSVTNLDNDVAGFVVSAISGQTSESHNTATFTVVLKSQPTADVTLGVASSNTSEGTVDKSTLTFTAGASGTWATPQTVTVTGLDNALLNGNQVYAINLSASTAAEGSSPVSYQNLAPGSVTLTNRERITMTMTTTTAGGGLMGITENGTHLYIVDQSTAANNLPPVVIEINVSTGLETGRTVTDTAGLITTARNGKWEGITDNGTHLFVINGEKQSKNPAGGAIAVIDLATYNVTQQILPVAGANQKAKSIFYDNGTLYMGYKADIVTYDLATATETTYAGVGNDIVSFASNGTNLYYGDKGVGGVYSIPLSSFTGAGAALTSTAIGLTTGGTTPNCGAAATGGAAVFQKPQGLFIHGGDMYVTEAKGPPDMIYEIVLSTDTCVDFAGLGAAGASASVDAPVSAADMNAPYSIVRIGNLFYFTEKGLMTVRKIY